MIRDNLLIEMHDVSVAYGTKTVLRNVNLSVYEHDFLGVIGPNGGGKTTLVKSILGLGGKVSGEINFYRNGQKTDEINVGYLPQYSSIDKKFPISVNEVILSGFNRHKGLFARFSEEQKERCSDIISQMGLDGLENRQIGCLSGGQLQRALLGRAIISSPEVLILDEPNTYIDKRFQKELYQLLSEINASCAVILVSHDIGSVMSNVKSIACVNETLHYHSDNELSEEWLEQHYGCPIDLIGHGDMPHRILKSHKH